MKPPQSTAPPVKELFFTFLRIGNLTFGGGIPTILAYQQEFVQKRRWLTPEQYLFSFGLARITPGTVLLAFCAAIGWQMLGWLGALIAVFGSTLPSAGLVVWLTYTYETWKESPVTQAIELGMLAAAVGIMGAVAWDLMRPGFTTPVNWLRTAVIVGGSVVLSLVFDWTPVPVLGAAAVAGLLWPDEEGAR
jgi:chromate transporter